MTQLILTYDEYENFKLYVNENLEKLGFNDFLRFKSNFKNSLLKK